MVYSPSIRKIDFFPLFYRQLVGSGVELSRKRDDVNRFV